MALMFNAYLLDAALQSMLESVTEKGIYVLRVPSEPTLPYAILYPQHASPGEGSWADPEEDRWWSYQLSSVGSDDRQCRWMQNKAMSAILDRSGNSFTNAIVLPTGNVVQGRHSDEIGAILPAGEELFQADDIFRLRVGK